MIILLKVRESCKEVFASLTRASGPSESERAVIRRHKPKRCPGCHAAGTLVGHGWRSRTRIEHRGRWEALWYWRVRCRSCELVLRLLPEQACGNLYYSLSSVAAVVVGRLAGASSRLFEPSRHTQSRWLERLRFWWEAARSAGAVEGPPASSLGDASAVAAAVWRCAQEGIDLFGAPRDRWARVGLRRAGNRLAIAAHQA